jgi:hypothetical protein
MTADEGLKSAQSKTNPSTGNVYQFIPRTQLSALPVKEAISTSTSPGNGQISEDDDPGPTAA